MNKICQFLSLFIALVLFAPLSQAEGTATSLEELLSIVNQTKNADTAANQQRITHFEQAQAQQAALLGGAQKQTQKLEGLSEQLNQTIGEKDREIAALEKQLSDRLGNFGELFGVTRQVAGDTRSQIANSLISAQFPGRDTALETIASSKTLPTVDQLYSLWYTLLNEQVEQGKVSRFEATVSNAQGFPETHEVIRIGPFTAVSDGEFLVYEASKQQLQHLPRQPGSQYRQAAEQLSQAPAGQIVAATIDPSSGAILSLLVQAPSLMERFKQGGLPGYVVSFLAVIGLALGTLRLISLWFTGMRVNRQMKRDAIELDNPLGRVLKVYEDNPKTDVETLELKLDDAVLKELPKLDRGLNTLKVLAAVAPLIGLLGTVIGMILTFQAITLWGTGEPKIMAGGISQALVTTVQGLIAAIPLLLLHSVTSGRARLVQQVLEEQSAGLIARRAELSHEDHPHEEYAHGEQAYG